MLINIRYNNENYGARFTLKDTAPWFSLDSITHLDSGEIISNPDAELLIKIKSEIKNYINYRP